MKIIFNQLYLKYQKELLNWIPNKILDVHTHTGLANFHKPLSKERKKNAMAASEFYEQSREELEESFKILFPGKKIEYVSFPFPFKETFIEKSNDYVLNSKYPFIMGNLENPQETLKILEEKKVKGLKMYYESVEKKYEDIKIFDFFPEEFMNKLNSLKKIIMLHVPGNSASERKNISQLVTMCTNFPKIKIILAHMGRIHSKEEMNELSKKLNNFENIFLETSTVTSSEVFEEAINGFGLEKILYGSDSPYARTKGKIMDVPGAIKNPFITKEIFSWTKPYLRRWYLKNKPELTFLVYHQLNAMKKAFEKINLNEEEKERIFYKNAKIILGN